MFENNKARKNQAFGVGLVSLLVLFSGMLIIVIAAMSIVTLSHCLLLHNKAQRVMAAVAVSENNLNIKLAEIDKALFETQQSSAAKNYYANAEEALLALGCNVQAGEKTASFKVPIDEHRAWQVQIEIMPRGSALRYNIVKKQIVQTENWLPQQEGELFSLAGKQYNLSKGDAFWLNI